MKRSRGPSMHDVAARAGVSHQTVSRVLNNVDGIRPETKQRVLDAISELGYRRNLAARTLATGQSFTIGMLGPEVPNFGPMSSRHAVEKAAREAGFHALVTSTTPEPGNVADALDFLLSRSIDALVLMAQHESVREVVDATVVGLPVVYLLTGTGDQPWSVSVDQRAGVRMAVDHLMDLGHRRIQHVAGPDDFTEAQLRREEFRHDVRTRGLEDLPVLQGDWTADSGFAAGQQVDPEATAVVCANDQMALGVMHALADQGRAVPAQVSVVGFDDVPESRHAMPPLTTVRQDFDGVGRLAVEAILARLGGHPQPDLTPVLPELIVRQSTGPAG